MIDIVNMKYLNAEQIEQAAAILTDVLPLGWATFNDAMDEIRELMGGDIGDAGYAGAAGSAGGVLGIIPDPIAAADDYMGGIPGAVFLAAIENNASGTGGVRGTDGAGGNVVGWCGILPTYRGKVYELHPLAVRRDMQRKGVGSALLDAITDVARGLGGLTMWIGADDEVPGGETSFANVDLYDDLPARLRDFEPGTHQAAFYMKHGFKIMGVCPDANGRGKPDIFLAKGL